jgi:hypothetical protein
VSCGNLLALPAGLPLPNQPTIRLGSASLFPTFYPSIYCSGYKGIEGKEKNKGEGKREEEKEEDLQLERSPLLLLLDLILRAASPLPQGSPSPFTLP